MEYRPRLSGQLFSPPQLTPEQIREKLEDPAYLPHLAEILTAFAPDRNKEISEEEELAYIKLWQNYLNREGSPVYEFLSEEFLIALSNYLSQRIKTVYHGTKASPVVILEVAAGDGRLTHFLSQKLEKLVGKCVKIISMDSGKDYVDPHVRITPKFPVERISQVDALVKYRPTIVICSWMPEDVDFTREFRHTSTVKEYVLIGEDDGGCCGKPWDTWGYGANHKKHEGELAPYQKEGFTRQYVEATQHTQLCRSDKPQDITTHQFSKEKNKMEEIIETSSHSSTVSFRRVL
ncbi:hypothetical protein A3A95_02800 [Candidatus Nomurabacteria bacterium RIFCSPLOWO2_01_FULL_39_18]|uniref:Methyltransferase domain-containing protein n=1 Tax=Candidatus Nomurabacteria bacterium RIFCSPHIGHO2_01_FULL_40_24b TaxID=1801739 RepID=A0A1F6V776_9BACT|nr:MAG: hypothetical protein A2647_03760 [Candidatus Nomurabacteria bacterium RIFCSPHIGHO2_01_FULL_40_24b]OGI89592.1 MAG: hypothetical protein A3A95_02800 [Candidatus Nomurabacteria bacterium RIFCSPLOWO2_01_FULL_39_18]